MALKRSLTAIPLVLLTKDLVRLSNLKMNTWRIARGNERMATDLTEASNSKLAVLADGELHGFPVEALRLIDRDACDAAEAGHHGDHHENAWALRYPGGTCQVR